MGYLYLCDPHFGHANIIGSCGRPFDDVDQMDEALIRNWNAKVSEEDHVYVGGDFAHRNAKSVVNYLNELSGHKHLVIGNHDYKWMKNEKALAMFESVEGLASIQDEGRRVVMCHYPLMTWPWRGSYMIHGHIHNNTHDAFWPLLAGNERALNACVEVNNYEPCTLDELIENNRIWKAAHS